MVDEEDLPAWSEPFATARQLVRAANLSSVDRDWAWGGATGKGVTIAIIDSGVERDHPRVHGRLVESVAVQTTADGHHTVEPDPSGIDLFGHGTACAGIITGLAPEVDIVSVRVLGADLKGKGTAFAVGLEWAIERGVTVANLSLSSKSETLFPIFHELADDAYFKNIVLVSAANNVPAPSYPSLFASVISVAAHSEPDPFRFYYNPSPPVEFGAWGVDVPIAWKDGTEIVATGNSFAAPHIAGLVSLIASKHPGLTPFEIKAVLAATADNPRSQPT
ncbi:MAG TPA: S8 family serine peptidase [Candidatus Limnocylindria bacterium]|nr:S8 family serine peptidase [Candidatus Limnocylindria bacterium]